MHFFFPLKKGKYFLDLASVKLIGWFYTTSESKSTQGSLSVHLVIKSFTRYRADTAITFEDDIITGFGVYQASGMKYFDNIQCFV